MELSTKDKINLIRSQLEKIDAFSANFNIEIQNISGNHKSNGGHVEYAYVEHFHKEITGLSKLFQYLLNDSINQKYVFFAVRGSIEILLYLEYILRLAQEDRNKVLSLLSRDMAQIGAAIDAAIPSDQEHLMYRTLKAVDAVNKILKTDFDLAKVKSNTRVFPPIRELCEKSSLNIKDLYGKDIYHIYAMYSESNHLRLGNQYSIAEEPDLLICWALEHFVEIYIKFYDQILNTNIFPAEYAEQLNSIKHSLGLRW